MYKVKFVDIGEGLHEGVVVSVYKKIEDKVEEGESLFSVETDKVTSDIPSPVSGVISEVLITEGQNIHVGEVVFVIDDGSGSTDEQEASEAKVEEEAPKSGASVVGSVEVSDQLLNFASFQNLKKNIDPSRETEDSSAPTSRRARRLLRLEEDRKAQESAEIQNLKEQGVDYQGPVDREFDVIVVGGGPGGYFAAELLGKKLKTLLIEKEYLGGVCLNVGCIPTKTLLKTTEILDLLEEAPQFGIHVKKVSFDWSEIQRNKTSVVERLTNGIKGLLDSSKVEVIKGEAEFIGSFVVRVNQQIYKAKNIILATGSLDKKLNQEGFEEGYQQGLVFTSKEALISQEALPKSIVIIGGGVIGCEMAQIYSGFGTRVTLLHAHDQLLNSYDQDVVNVLVKNLQKRGVEIIYNALPKELDTYRRVLYYTKDGQSHSLSFEKILSAVGRYPVNANVDKVGVKVNPRGAVETNDALETNLKGFFAIGDCNGKNMLAHAAYRQAQVVANNILGTTDSIAGEMVPDAVYTHPELASIGLNESQAKAANKDFVVAKFNFAHLGRGVCTHKSEGFCKLIVQKTNGEILGAQIVGPQAGDLISEISVAIAAEASVFEIAKAIHPHPSFSEILWESARIALQRLK